MVDRPLLHLAATLLGGTEGAFGQNKVAEHFTKEIAQSFLKSSRKSYAMRAAAKLGKPLIVLLTKRVGVFFPLSLWSGGVGQWGTANGIPPTLPTYANPPSVPPIQTT